VEPKPLAREGTAAARGSLGQRDAGSPVGVSVGARLSAGTGARRGRTESGLAAPHGYPAGHGEPGGGASRDPVPGYPPATGVNAPPDLTSPPAMETRRSSGFFFFSFSLSFSARYLPSL